MAQDLFVFCLGGDDGPAMDKERVWSILAVDAVAPRNGNDLQYRDGSGCLEPSIGRNGDSKGEPEAELRCLNFQRFGGRIMMERLFALAEALDIVLTWTDTYDDDPSACVVGAGKLDRMDADMRDALEPVEARDPSHLNQLVKGSTFDECGW